METIDIDSRIKYLKSMVEFKDGDIENAKQEIQYANPEYVVDFLRKVQNVFSHEREKAQYVKELKQLQYERKSAIQRIQDNIKEVE